MFLRSVSRAIRRCSASEPLRGPDPAVLPLTSAVSMVADLGLLQPPLPLGQPRRLLRNTGMHLPRLGEHSLRRRRLAAEPVGLLHEGPQQRARALAGARGGQLAQQGARLAEDVSVKVEGGRDVESVGLACRTVRTSRGWKLRDEGSYDHPELTRLHIACCNVNGFGEVLRLRCRDKVPINGTVAQ